MSAFISDDRECLAVAICLALPEFGKVKVSKDWVVVNLGTENKRSTEHICKTIRGIEETVGSEVNKIGSGYLGSFSKLFRGKYYSRIGESSGGLTGNPTKFFNAKRWLEGLETEGDVPNSLVNVIKEETFNSLFAFPDEFLTKVEQITKGNNTKLLPYPRPENEGQTFK